MKILVIDDNPGHLQAAKEQLEKDHDLRTTDSYETAIELLVPGTDIQIVLSDLRMPAEPYCLGGKGLQFLGHPMAIGWILLFRAAAAGISRIAVITDTNHHEHPESAALDWICPPYWNTTQQPRFQVNDSTVLIAHAPLLPDGRKNWAEALQRLLET